MSAADLTGLRFHAGRSEYVVLHEGCSTGWDKCSHGTEAVAVVRAGRPASWAECWGRAEVLARLAEETTQTDPALRPPEVAS